MRDFETIAQKLVAFIQNAVKNRGFDAVVFGLSGGIDSAVVARLCQLAFKDSHKALMLPSRQSSKESLEHALELCEKFGIQNEIISISAPQDAFLETLPNLAQSQIRLGNLCSRLRMICLYDYAFANNALVVGTSNKSEILLGYGTIYGDLACAINPIGNLYKTEIYKLAKVLEIPQSIMQKAPSADLYAGQSDEEELGFSYATLDRIMLLLLEGKDDVAILAQGLPKDALNLVRTRMKHFAFKQKMPDIAQI
ncbi:NAD+ synthase [Helicobacter turcicus]|uniref:NH(3)-dependent NAD(+) synthetase n=1 Tax=Helicobacter turcicus TaxID=2867412 RepID=A0ABS7JP50_9HELI|nr:NAD+ synthase [Helicobacter turcicus]MBX7491134.1 NAD+ synthase [Helicobacter turcicus]MBX7545998.1 NAD+ synthase [Helicobacter turcicus]